MQAGPMLAVGPSSVAQALAAAHDGDVSERAPPVALRRNGPHVGSGRQPVSGDPRPGRGATGYRRLAIDPGRLLDDANYAGTLCDQALALMLTGNLMLVDRAAIEPAAGGRARRRRDRRAAARRPCRKHPSHG